LNLISITFFAYFCNLENLKHKPKIAKMQQGQVKKRQKLWQEFGKSDKSKKVAMVLTGVGSFAQQIKTYSLNSSMTFTMELPASLPLSHFSYSYCLFVTIKTCSKCN